MIIRDLNVEGVTTFPFKTNSPWIVDPNAELSFTIPALFFKTIRGRNTQILNVDGIVDHVQFPQRHMLDISRQLP